MRLSQDIVKNLAQLAKLDLSDQELEIYQKQLAEVLAYVEKINTLDLGNTSESLSGVDNMPTTLREDKSQESQPAIIHQAAERQDNYVVSPGVFNK